MRIWDWPRFMHSPQLATCSTSRSDRYSSSEEICSDARNRLQRYLVSPAWTEGSTGPSSSEKTFVALGMECCKACSIRLNTRPNSESTPRLWVSMLSGSLGSGRTEEVFVIIVVIILPIKSRLSRHEFPELFEMGAGGLAHPPWGSLGCHLSESTLKMGRSRPTARSSRKNRSTKAPVPCSCA